ncbi:type-F conjugative transfer system protein TraW [soil metagenome]
MPLKRLFLLALFITSGLPIFVLAKDLGVRGQVYPIVETDLLEDIKTHLLIMQKNGELSQITTKLEQKRKLQLDRPKAVPNITRTEQARTWLFDPSIRIKRDITNTEGQVVVMAGSWVNPLNTLFLPYTLIFYNADDPLQVQWAQRRDRELKDQVKLILVGGSVTEQRRLFKKSVFFDQSGLLTTRFQLKHVPAEIQQRGNQLQIQEVKL